MARIKTVLFVHGRSFKPPAADLKRLWLAALRHGLSRDRPELLARFNAARKELVYCGDLSNRYLRATGRTFDASAGLADRRRSLAQLKARSAGNFGRRAYRDTPGRSPYKEFLADLLGSPLNALRLSDRLLSIVALDMAEYWNPEAALGSEMRLRMVKPLKRALRLDGSVLIMSHSLGAVVTYDTLWKFSHAGEYREAFSHRMVDVWMTLGSPLSDETVKRHLRGSLARGPRRFPANVRRWINVAAEDDYIAHDQRAANDYAAMTRAGFVESISDRRIYNFAIKGGQSNPHASSGYLVHPTVVSLVADWLQDD